MVFATAFSVAFMIDRKSVTENENITTYTNLPLQIENGEIKEYYGLNDGTVELEIPSSYDIDDQGNYVAGETYKITKNPNSLQTSCMHRHLQKDYMR